jgi:Uma2 family endonuclease
MVRCGTPAHSLFEDDARFIVEVISPSNTPGSRTEMLYDYQTVPSIETIVFIDTRQRAVTIHHKVGDGWTERGTRNGTFDLGDVTIDMEKVWVDVDDVASYD